MIYFSLLSLLKSNVIYAIIINFLYILLLFINNYCNEIFYKSILF